MWRVRQSNVSCVLCDVRHVADSSSSSRNIQSVVDKSDFSEELKKSLMMVE